MQRAPWATDKWWVSHYNFDEEVRKELSLPDKVELHDSTLRDGEQTPGVVLRLEEKVRIAEELDKVEINRIEAGMPVVSKEDKEAIKAIVKLGLKAKIFSFCRASKIDIDESIECDVDGVIIEFPSSYPKLKYQFMWKEEDLINRAVEAIQYAKEHGFFVSAFPYDTTRADFGLLRKIITEASNYKSDSIAVVDTMGCALPQAMAHLVRKIKDMVRMPIEVHTHNDMGLAVANTLAAIGAGAEIAHGTINGIGERAGNAAVEEIAVNLHTLYGFDLKFDFGKLYELSKLVRNLTLVEVSLHKPIVGDNQFARESGIGIDKLFEYPLSMFSILPEFVGQNARALIGKKSGTKSVELKLKELGMRANDEEVKDILQKIKEEATKKKGVLSDDEFKAIATKVLNPRT